MVTLDGQIAEAQAAAAAAAAALQEEEEEEAESKVVPKGSAVNSPRSSGASGAIPVDGTASATASEGLRPDSGNGGVSASERPLSPEIELQVGTDDTSLQPALHRVGGTDEGQVGVGGLLVFTGASSIAEPVVLWHEPQAHNDVITSLLLVPEMKCVEDEDEEGPRSCCIYFPCLHMNTDQKYRGLALGPYLLVLSSIITRSFFFFFFFFCLCLSVPVSLVPELC